MANFLANNLIHHTNGKSILLKSNAISSFHTNRLNENDEKMAQKEFTYSELTENAFYLSELKAHTALKADLSGYI